MGIIDSARNNLRAKLPLLIIGMVCFGCAMFSAVAVVPQVKTYGDLAAQVDSGQQAIAATMTQQSQSDTAIFLQRQIEGAQTRQDQASSAFLTQAQVDDLLHKIYDSADTSGAKIANLQEQPGAQSAQGAPNTANIVYDTRIFHLQINGSVIQLMNFVILLREASTPGVVISDLNLSSSQEQYALAMNISIYTSPFASGKAYGDLAGKATPAPIALASTLTASPASTPLTSAGPLSLTATPILTTDTATLVGQCDQHYSLPMGELSFSQIQHASGTCDEQIWNFKLDKETAFVMDIVRQSGSGLYRMELHDSNDKAIAMTLSSVDGRGILVANSAAGSYTLNIIPLAATGTWAYDIAIWPGLPALSFSWAQNSYSSHTGLGTQSNTMIWEYVLTGGTQTYHIESTRTDGNLEYKIVVLDASQAQVATVNSDNGNATVNLTTGNGTYEVRIVTVDGTSGSYRIGLVR